MPAPPKPSHRPTSGIGVLGGTLAALVGALIVVSTVGIVDSALRDKNMLAGLMLGTATIGGLVGVAVLALGIAAAFDARGKHTGSAAGRLWSLFGAFGLLSLAGLVAEPSVELGVVAAILLLVATPNFVAWRGRER